MTLNRIQTFFYKNKSWLILGVILLLAAFVRFYHIETKMRFIWDEGRDMMAIRRIITEKDITLFGPFNEMGEGKDFFGVFHYYLMLPALWLADYNPVGPAIFTALLGVTSVFLVYQLISMWDNQKLALWVAAIYALSPPVVEYVIWPWNPNTMPFFGLLYLIFLRKWFEKPSALWTALAGFTLGLLFQLHYFSIALVVPWLMLMWARKSFFKIVYPFLFIFTFLFANINFILFDLTHEWFYFKILKDSFVGDSSQQLFNFSLTHFVTTPFIFTNSTFSKLLTLPEITTWPVTVLFIGLSFKRIKEFFVQNKLDLDIMIIGGWLGFLSIISFFPSLDNNYYASYLWFGLLYILIRGAIRASNHCGYKPIFVLAGVLFCARLFISIDLNRSPTWQENMPLVRQLAEVVAKDAAFETKTINIASLADSNTRTTRYRYFLDVNEIKPLSVDDYSQTEILYIISPHDVATSRENPAWEISTFVDQQWQLLDRIEELRVFKVVKK
ncbi:glycosyltransferase family 39 protein [Patescibacteria group bacterium]|nr:glycosyltransferase family 39 protein [Patescibacteria group bacterium]